MVDAATVRVVRQTAGPYADRSRKEHRTSARRTALYFSSPGSGSSAERQLNESWSLAVARVEKLEPAATFGDGNERFVRQPGAATDAEHAQQRAAASATSLHPN